MKILGISGSPTKDGNNEKVITNVLSIAKNIKAVLMLFLIIIVCFFIFLPLQAISLTSLMVALMTSYIAYEVFNYTKLRDIPYLSVEIVNMGIYSEDEIRTAKKIINVATYTKDGVRKTKKIRTAEDMRKRKIPRLVFKNMGNEGLEARLGVYLCEWTGGSVEMEGLTNDKVCSKLEKIEPDLEINLSLDPNEIHDSYLYEVIEVVIQDTKRKENVELKEVEEYMYFNSKKSHLIVFKGEYKSIWEDSMSRKFCRSFFLAYISSFDKWIILSKNIEFKLVSPQKKSCSRLFKLH